MRAMPWSRWGIAALLAGVVSCRSPDAIPRRDAEADSGTEADAVSGDALALRDAPDAACEPPARAAYCAYRGYGSTCELECSQPPGCVFTVTVRWSDGYCCGTGMETYRNCRCVEGRTVCIEGDAGRPPTTYCEFCSRDGG